MEVVRVLRIFCVLAVLAVLLGAAGAAAGGRERDISAYEGLATWADIYATTTWAAPEAAVSSMAARGVRTLFLETGNSRQREPIVRPEIVARFVDAAHDAGIRVVAWYLPSLVLPQRDLRRALAAVRFRTPSGGRFDSFALDIESSNVPRITLRNARLLDLSRRLRAAVGHSYALGAIVPSAVGMRLHPTYWRDFPYAALARLYDVFLPMAYSTYRVRGAASTRAYVVESIAGVRTGVGDPEVPVHVIGGLTAGIGAAEAAGFMRAVASCTPVGYSLYEFPTTRPLVWATLREEPAATAGAC
jgi:hypothetical protein